MAKSGIRAVVCRGANRQGRRYNTQKARVVCGGAVHPVEENTEPLQDAIRQVCKRPRAFASGGVHQILQGDAATVFQPDGVPVFF